MPGKRLNSQAQEMVIHLLEYFEREKINGGPIDSINAVQERVASALHISAKTVYTIKQRKKENPILASPGKSRPRKKAATLDMPEASKMKIRNCLYDMYKEKEHVTVKTLNNTLKRKEVVDIGKSSLKVLLHDLGFKFKKEDNRRGLTEKLEIACLRTSFLRKYSENKHSTFSRHVIFLDETWIYSKGSKRKSWQDDNIKSVRKPEGYDGKRFIVLHAGSSTGFVQNASLLFHSKSNTLDYHGEMNGTIFTTWVKEKLIPNLDEPSLIVMDNAPYHSALQEKQPCGSWKKLEISGWLKEHNIKFDDNLTKPELLQIAKFNKKPNIYVIDELLRENGHEVLRLPPYHCEFNAIELIWARAKGYYNQNIGRDGYGDEQVLRMWEEALAASNDHWRKCVEHTDKIINEWHIRESVLVNCEVKPLIISVNDSSSDSESE